MVDPDHAIALWDELIGSAPVPDPQKARELLMRVQGRKRTAEMPETSFEPVTAPEDEFAPDAPAPLLPVGDDPPVDLHDLLGLFH
jgi:hypothetical protein